MKRKIFNINRLREYRLSRGISQAHMARQLGYKSTSGYSNIERGKSSLTFERALEISQILQEDMEVLLVDEVEEAVVCVD
ncbi:helix-turn-helix transcriptional regulator [Bacillus badius]|uniref:helix-turn-helix transcriptional regulator n=1 Tax=Bacillus badius TaxID=1455 RepID=UPI0005970823|nr:helix-turn-helix transcriptional regulator [Bacillus badius]